MNKKIFALFVAFILALGWTMVEPGQNKRQERAKEFR